MAISDRDKQNLKQLIFSPQWKVVEQVVEMMCQDIRGRSKITDTEWETLKKILTDEGEERGIKRLMQQINDYAIDKI